MIVAGVGSTLGSKVWSAQKAILEWVIHFQSSVLTPISSSRAKWNFEIEGISFREQTLSIRSLVTELLIPIIPDELQLPDV